MAVWRICAGAPPAVEREWLVSHEAVYTRVLYPLPASRSWPVTGVMLVFEAHQRSAASTWRVLRTHPGSWGWSALVDHPEGVADRRAPGAPGRCGLNTSGTYGTSAAADPGREAQPSGSVDDPGSTRWGRNT